MSDCNRTLRPAPRHGCRGAGASEKTKGCKAPFVLDKIKEPEAL